MSRDESCNEWTIHSFILWMNDEEMSNWNLSDIHCDLKKINALVLSCLFVAKNIFDYI